MAASTFINQCHCLITRTWAEIIDKNEEDYLAESPVSLLQERYDIDSVFYKKEDDDVAAYWGVIRVNYEI